MWWLRPHFVETCGADDTLRFGGHHHICDTQRPVTVAFVLDPDGYSIELLQRHEGAVVVGAQ